MYLDPPRAILKCDQPPEMPTANRKDHFNYLATISTLSPVLHRQSLTETHNSIRRETLHQCRNIATTTHATQDAAQVLPFIPSVIDMRRPMTMMMISITLSTLFNTPQIICAINWGTISHTHGQGALEAWLKA